MPFNMQEDYQLENSGCKITIVVNAKNNFKINSQVNFGKSNNLLSNQIGPKNDKYDQNIIKQSKYFLKLMQTIN